MSAEPPLVQVDNVVREYRLPRKSLIHAAPLLRVLHGVSLAVTRGTRLGRKLDTWEKHTHGHDTPLDLIER